MSPSPRQLLLEIYAAALAAVEARTRVCARLASAPFATPIHLVAIGKAACGMAQGAADALGDALCAGLVITRHGYADPGWRDARITVLEAGHPVPDQDSLDAGQALLDFLAAAPAEASFVFLISGGASALIEVLPEAMDLEAYQEVNRWLLASGWDIVRVNRVRKALSRIKGGRLARYLAGRPALNLLLSDVPGDDPAAIGSGLLVSEAAAELEDLPTWLWSYLVPPAAPCYAAVTTEILLTNREARQAALEAGVARGLEVQVVPGLLQGDAVQAGHALAETVLAGPPGLYVWGGETTVILPPEPGRGGRCQQLALAAAQVLAGHEGIFLLAAGTDGSDGPGEDAGALVDGETLLRGGLGGYDAIDCLRRADAGSFLEASTDLIQTGPTGSNVMDLVLALKVARD